jgi:hypothetical protein
MTTPAEVPDAGAAALAWVKLPELPPHREPFERLRFQGRARKVTVLPTDAVLVRTEALEPEGIRATFHHARKHFIAAETREPLTNVIEWAMLPPPSPP